MCLKEASYKAPSFTRTRFCVLVTNKLPLWMVPSENKPPQSSHIEKICLWTKFQPPTWLLTLSGPIFTFQPPLNNLPL